MAAKAAQTWKPIDDEFTIDDIGARLLANLARGIYNHEAVLREYVQNACDAYNALPAFPSHATIKINIEDGSTISIHDDGIGMDLEGVRAYKRIAVSPKAELENMTGFRGIGIWAGFQACRQLELITTKAGERSRYRLQIDFEEILKHVDENINIKSLLDGRFRVHTEPADTSENYTHVRLIGLQQDYQKLTDGDELERIVSQHLPCKIDPKFAHANDVSQFLNSVGGYQEFSILVENNEVFKSFPEELERPQFLPLRHDGEEYGRVWYCSSNRSINQQGNEFRGFRLRINNFAVGPVGIYADEDGASFGLFDSTLRGTVHLNWHVGEIHITHQEIVPDTPRSALELDSVARRAVLAIRGFYKDRIADSRALSESKKFRTVLDECERMSKAGEVPSKEKLSSWIVSFAEQDRIARDRSRSQDEVKKRLREYLTARDTKLQRQRLANWVRELERASTSEDEPPRSDTSSTSGASARRQAGGRSASRATVTTTAAQAAQPEVNFDQLLSDIIAVVEVKLGTDDENYLPLCRAIEDVFRKGGLTE